MRKIIPSRLTPIVAPGGLVALQVTANTRETFSLELHEQQAKDLIGNVGLVLGNLGAYGQVEPEPTPVRSMQGAPEQPAPVSPRTPAPSRPKLPRPRAKAKR